MQKKIYENSSLSTGFSYAVYMYGYTLSEMSYYVYEYDQDGNLTMTEKFSSQEAAIAFVKNKCK